MARPGRDGWLATRGRALGVHWLSIAQMSAGAGLAWFLARDVVGHERGYFAPIAAVVVLGLGPGGRTRRAVELAVGVALGIAVGDLLIAGIGSGPWQVMLFVALASGVAVLLGAGPMLASQAAVSAALVATLTASTDTLSVSRFVDSLIGGSVGLAVLIAFPGNPLRTVRRAADALLAELAAVLDDVAHALERHDHAAARDALARARSLDSLVVELRESLELARETVNLAPTRWKARSPIARIRLASTHVEYAVRNTRVLARASLRALELEARIDEDVVAAVLELGIAVRALRAEIEDGGDGRAVGEAAVRAAGRSSLALVDGASLSISVLVGQIRSTSADLLRAIGLDREIAVDLIRTAADDRPPVTP